MFKDFNISSFKKLKPPSNNSFDTLQEIKQLKNTPLNKKKAEDHDDINGVFLKIAKKNNIINYDKSISDNLINESKPIILKLKKHFNRPRPKVMAKKFGIKMKDYEMKSMKTPAYPSGHSAQGMLVARVLADKHPKSAKAFLKAGKNISDSRRSARAHYMSDSRMGESLGNAMYKHIKNKNNAIFTEK